MRSAVSQFGEMKIRKVARTFKLLPTIIFSTRNNSPFEMNPSRSTSYTLKATKRWAQNDQQRQDHHLKERRIWDRTFQFLFPSTSTAKRAQPANKFLEIDRTSTTVQGYEDKVSLIEQSGTTRQKSVKTHSSSKMAIIRDASGLVAICGIWRNSSRSMDPEPSLESEAISKRQVRIAWTQME